jgi:hypothetical protein
MIRYASTNLDGQDRTVTYLLAVGYKNRYELREEWWYRLEVELERLAPRAFRAAA